MNTELETLRDLELASRGRLYGPIDHLRPNDLYRAYGYAAHRGEPGLPQEHIQSLVKKGLWYILSATQGNITEAGGKALGWPLRTDTLRRDDMLPKTPAKASTKKVMRWAIVRGDASMLASTKLYSAARAKRFVRLARKLGHDVYAVRFGKVALDG